MFTVNDIEKFNKWFSTYKKQKNSRNNFSIGKTQREMWLEQNKCPIEEKIVKFYNNGIGYKRLCKELNISYTSSRNLFKKFDNINVRTGTNVVTDELRKIRSENVKGEKSPFYDWPKLRPNLMKTNGKSIQGFYERKHDKKKVWLRSTYEYIFAKWLDCQNIIWYVEEQCFELKSGERYRPDFFLYENDVLKSIVEVKSRYFNKDNREYKFHEFKEQFNINCMLVTDINLFISEDSNYHKELKEWKLLQENSNQKE